MTSAREETLRTVIGLALHDNGDLRDHTTRQTHFDRRLVALYRAPFSFAGDWAEDFRPIRRSGILTQISMLSMFSHPGRSSPTSAASRSTSSLLTHARAAERRRPWSTIPKPTKTSASG